MTFLGGEGGGESRRKREKRNCTGRPVLSVVDKEWTGGF